MALPVALLGLLGISVLVVGVLITSTGESASSAAHQDGTRQFFAVEGGIEAFVATQGNLFVPGQALTGFQYTPPGATRALSISVHEVAAFVTPIPDQFERHFAVRGEPVGGGRGLFAMVTTSPLQLDINSAAVFGGDARLSGNTLVSDGRDSESCSDARADDAILHASGAEVTRSGNTQVLGEQTESALEADDLIRAVLGGMSMEEFAIYVHRQGLPDSLYVAFGTNPIWGTRTAFSGTGSDKPASIEGNRNNWSPRARTHRYHWYCPGKQDDALECWNKVPQSDTLANKIILVDAADREITLQGDHGQGMILVLNGGIRISGGFVFRGIILADKDIDMQGTGNKVEGAIISRNEVRIDRPNDSDSEISGDAVIRFNRCAINSVMNSLNPVGGVPRVLRTTNWAELLR
jgi:hypothetical protein